MLQLFQNLLSLIFGFFFGCYVVLIHLCAICGICSQLPHLFHYFTYWEKIKPSENLKIAAYLCAAGQFLIFLLGGIFFKKAMPEDGWNMKVFLFNMVLLILFVAVHLHSKLGEETEEDEEDEEGEEDYPDRHRRINDDSF